MKTKETKKKLDKLAEKYGFDFADFSGKYKEYELYIFGVKEPSYTNYPIFALVKGKKIKLVHSSDKKYNKIRDYVIKKLGGETEQNHAGKKKNKLKEKLNKIAQKKGFDFAVKKGVYKGSKLWGFDLKVPSCAYYEVFALVKGKKIKLVQFGDKRYNKIQNCLSKSESCNNNAEQQTKEVEFASKEIKMQEKMDRFAKKCGFDFAIKRGVYKGFELWGFVLKLPAYVCYPIHALVKSKKIKVIHKTDKEYKGIRKYIVTLCEKRKQQSLKQKS